MDIDLGKKCDSPSVCCSPCPPPKDAESKIYYPTLYIDQEGKELEELPEEGTLTIRYKTCSKTTRERDGKKSVCLELDVKAIVGAEKKDKTRGDELDELREKSSKDEDYDEEE